MDHVVTSSSAMGTTKVSPAIIIHSGAGVGMPEHGDPAKAEAVRASLARILRSGERLLSEGRSALDIVEFCVRMLEDDPLFNAGRGAALTSEATIEHDATIADGRDRRVGAVAAVGRVRNPVSAARAVMERSPHVLLVGAGAEDFARRQGLEIAPPWYFFTQSRLEALERVKRSAEAAVSEQDSHGTVGAVALDIQGNLAAATSTGGRANKLPGRVGDSAIIGAGTYADNRFCALSATGSGEPFIRSAFAHRVSNLIELSHLDLAAASELALADIRSMKGGGGFVGLTPGGRAVSRFTGYGMNRGYVKLGGITEVAIYADEPFSPDQLTSSVV